MKALSHRASISSFGPRFGGVQALVFAEVASIGEYAVDSELSAPSPPHLSLRPSHLPYALLPAAWLVSYSFCDDVGPHNNNACPPRRLPCQSRGEGQGARSAQGSRRACWVSCHVSDSGSRCVGAGVWGYVGWCSVSSLPQYHAVPYSPPLAYH